ncbi:MAG: hypothetical protein O2854_10180, partial [Chloroflexi bacterium]|nr:hypothetical protein [Chloroflexota bacterium]
VVSEPAEGTLEYNNAAIPSLPHNIDAANIGLLTFTPTPNVAVSPYTTFDFKVYDGGQESATATMTINVTDDDNDAPVMMAAAEVEAGTTGPIGNVQAKSEGTPSTGYAVTGGANMSLFTIVAGTGELTMTSNAGAEGATYEVEVTFTDSVGSSKILIEVTSVSATVSGGTIFILR